MKERGNGEARERRAKPLSYRRQGSGGGYWLFELLLPSYRPPHASRSQSKTSVPFRCLGDFVNRQLEFLIALDESFGLIPDSLWFGVRLTCRLAC